MLLAPQCPDSRGPECILSVAVIGWPGRNGLGSLRGRVTSELSREGREWQSDQEIHEHEMEEGYEH